jgi:hypothetical protein
MKPLLLGHQSEKVKELWNKVDRREFLRTHNFSEGYITSITAIGEKGKTKFKKYSDYRVTELIKDLATFRRLSRPRYQFLKPDKI